MTQSSQGAMPPHVKKYLVDHIPAVGSSHLTEALAAAAGYRTNAAYIADVANEATVRALPFNALDGHAFVRRLVECTGDHKVDSGNLRGILLGLFLGEDMKGTTVAVGPSSLLIKDAKGRPALRPEPLDMPSGDLGRLLEVVQPFLQHARSIPVSAADSLPILSTTNAAGAAKGVVTAGELRALDALSEELRKRVVAPIPTGKRSFPPFADLGITLGDDWLHAIDGMDHGLVVVAGPPRSGITTTVRATVQAMISKGRSAARPDDPFLLAPPDGKVEEPYPRIMVFGEIDRKKRLVEALRLAERHVVIAELNEGSVAGALRKLADMVLPARLRDHLRVVLSQRLLGKHCAQDHGPRERCPQCHGKSVLFPTVVSELQIFESGNAMHGAVLDAIKGRSSVLRSMRQDALVKLDQGLIVGSDFDEVFGSTSPVVKSFGV